MQDSDVSTIVACPKCRRSLTLVGIVNDWLCLTCQRCRLEVRVRPQL